MKEVILIFMVAFLTLCGQAQDEFGVTIKDTVFVDSSNIASLKQPALNAPPTDPNFSFKNNDFVNKTIDDFEYWNAFFEGYQTTLYIYPNAKSSADSILVAKNETNTFYFKKTGSKWLVKNFIIKSSNITLRQIGCGQTSKEVFKFLNKKNHKPIDDGQVWVYNKKGDDLIVLTFSKDKLICMQY